MDHTAFVHQLQLHRTSGTIFHMSCDIIKAVEHSSRLSSRHDSERSYSLQMHLRTLLNRCCKNWHCDRWVKWLTNRLPSWRALLLASYAPLLVAGSVLQHEVQVRLLDVGQAQLDYLKQSRAAVNAATTLTLHNTPASRSANFVNLASHNKACNRRRCLTTADACQQASKRVDWNTAISCIRHIYPNL